MSQTLPSTTIHKSCALSCLEISADLRTFWLVVDVRLDLQLSNGQTYHLERQCEGIVVILLSQRDLLGSPTYSGCHLTLGIVKSTYGL